MLQILTSSKSATEQAVVVVARELGIPCVVAKPQRNGAARRSCRQCLQHAAAEADATLVLGARVVPYSSAIDTIWSKKPIRTLSIANALHFDPSGANTRKWLAKWHTVHISGTASKQAATAFLRVVLKAEKAA